MRDLWAAYLAVTWASASFEAWLTPRPTLHRHANGDYLLSMPRVTSWQAIWRSALVPGAGQRYLGRNTRANVTAFLTYGLTAGGLIAYDALLDARRDRDEAQRRYDQAVTTTQLERRRGVLDAASADANDRNTWRWSLLGAAAAVHLWSILDAWQVASYSGSSPSGQAEPSSDLSFQIAPEPSGMRAALAWRLP